ncbi:epoxide hydrolase family protein [Cryobacterium sp. HLT2-28]|uniref:epoxide hydrolase family protein n=1 Tax=Cryobacterium sp. HLT2-28 TaxID=1259146 RepID=UPI00106DB8BB|nr:epoxide hydrolase family protein [Cryobacterium sp. HLT2-28]TFB97870.1 epoxide hydrolase [Cryobacterium sp. HLT2-28]
MDTTHDSTITSFRVDIPQADIDDLTSRLRTTRIPAPLPGNDWDTGIPSGYLQDLVTDWAEDFDWRAFEARLNEVPQFMTVIDGQRIHFAHVRSAVPDATPVLLTHGWPGSFLEFLHLIGPLTDPEAYGGDRADAVHLIIPSLPGFGFSTPLNSAGWTTAHIAAAWVELMDRLGYGRFLVQGGDLGAVISPEIARVAPKRVIGVHINGALGFSGDISEDDRAAMSPLDQDRMARVRRFMNEEYGYISIQSTRPGLVGVALADSPVAQLAWMLDKFRSWTWPLETLPDEILGREWILANASLYWFTASGGSSAYVGYAQNSWGATPANSGVPTAAIQFAHDVGIRSQSIQANTIVRWNDFEDHGGHFAALEEPELLINDLRGFLHQLKEKD